MLFHYWLEIVCLCADNSSSPTVPNTFDASSIVKSSQFSADCSLRLILKALSGLLCVDVQQSDMALTDEELKFFLNSLESQSYSQLCASECVIPCLLKGLLKNKENAEKFYQHNLRCILQQKTELLTCLAILNDNCCTCSGNSTDFIGNCPQCGQPSKTLQTQLQDKVHDPEADVLVSSGDDVFDILKIRDLTGLTLTYNSFQCHVVQPVIKMLLF